MSSVLSQIKKVDSIQSLISTPFTGNINALYLERQLQGNFYEIVAALETSDNITIIEPDDLKALVLTPNGAMAREIILQDYESLQNAGASPNLNIIKAYDRDNAVPNFPTDVYSYHVDRSPIPTSTFLCTYYGATSEILSNEEANLKIEIPEIRTALKNQFNGPDSEFNDYLTAHFFDLHYQPKIDAKPFQLGNGNLWRLAVDYPNNPVKPCIHRAPLEENGQSRLLLIC